MESIPVSAILNAETASLRFSLTGRNTAQVEWMIRKESSFEPPQRTKQITVELPRSRPLHRRPGGQAGPTLIDGRGSQCASDVVSISAGGPSANGLQCASNLLTSGRWQQATEINLD